VATLRAIPGGRAEPPSAPGFPAGGREDAGPSGPRLAPGDGRGLLEDLYRRHAAGVYARCRYLLRDEEAARDAAQDVFVRTLRALPELRAAASPTAFLLRAATNHCLNALRASRAAWREELARVTRERRERGIVPESRELVRALLAVAPEEAQEVAVLYFVDELTQAEIAEATGRSLPTVRKRLREFLVAARGALAEAFPELSLPDPEELP
jgi:RNA polymerase sigma-70 factor (ECF subfamily)